MSNAIEEIIGHLRNPFIIKEDGSRQTDHANTGRVGFHVEKLFGVTPNNDRTPDPWSVGIKNNTQRYKSYNWNYARQ
jgi:hypothetical protein